MRRSPSRHVVAALGLAALVLAGAAQGPGASAQTPSARYIVTTRSSAATVRQLALLQRSGRTVDERYSRVLHGFAATLTARDVRLLRADASVTAVTPDVRISVGSGATAAAPAVTRSATTAASTAVPWGLDRIDQRARTGNGRYRYDTTGAGVTVFVVDSGIRFSHREFGGRAVSGHDFVDSDSDAADCEGHGTHVAGTIGGKTYGVAKRVRLVSLRIFDCNGQGYLSDLVAALDWAVAHKPAGPAVLNFSGGGAVDSTADTAVSNTIKAGISVVVAAGNDTQPACDASPGRVPAALTVAASDQDDREAEFSDYGSCVDLFAPGVDVLSASVASDTASERMSGTSMAAPHVTGAVARYLQSHPGATPAQVSAGLTAVATRGALTLTETAPNRLLFTSRASLTYAPDRVRPGRRH